jgi:membrane associated rhomboid family serine protease
MVIPYRTDAPLYHYPIGTLLLVVLCITIHGARYWWDIPFDTWALPLGQNLTPVNWVTGNFVHIDYLHLLGNVLFLWLFGMIVEGKVGFWVFMFIALFIGVGESSVEQLLLLWHTPTYSGGASVIVYGLMGMALIWAPDNEVECVGQTYYCHVFQVDLTIYCFVGLYLLLGIFDLFTSGFSLGSSILHLGGMAIGMTVASVMLYRRWVECEGYDFFTRYAGILNLPEHWLPPQSALLTKQAELGDELLP